MSEETRLREDICLLAQSMYDRGLTCGSSGNISALLSSGHLLVTPTGSCFGRLDPAKLSLFNDKRELISGDKPTKEMPLHTAFYDTRKIGAVVHLHSTYSVALSVLPDNDEDNFLPPITAYGIMRLGRVKLLPYFMPGSYEIGDAIRGLAGKRSAVMLAHHGPVVTGKELDATVYAMEELEESAKLTMLTKGLNRIHLNNEQITALTKAFDVDW